MDHRCGTRRPIGITLLIRRRGWGGWKVGRLENLSITGAFVAVDPGDFSVHGTVQIEATPPGGAVTGLMSCRAMVVRRTPEGLGLAFDQPRPPALEPLFRSPAKPPGAATLPGERPRSRPVPPGTPLPAPPGTPPSDPAPSAP